MTIYCYTKWLPIGRIIHSYTVRSCTELDGGAVEWKDLKTYPDELQAVMHVNGLRYARKQERAQETI